MTLRTAKEITNDDGTLKEVNYEFVELRLVTIVMFNADLQSLLIF